MDISQARSFVRSLIRPLPRSRTIPTHSRLVIRRENADAGRCNGRALMDDMSGVAAKAAAAARAAASSNTGSQITNDDRWLAYRPTHRRIDDRSTDSKCTPCSQKTRVQEPQQAGLRIGTFRNEVRSLRAIAYNIS